jgi:hypothetical protein
MPSDAGEFAKQYAVMSEPELLETARAYDSLIDPAQNALRAEFARRNLDPPLLEEDIPFDPRKFVTIRRYRDLSEAIVARTLLESAGIEVILQNENLVRIDWQISNGIGGIRLQVDVLEASAALEILNEPIPDPIDFGSGSNPDQTDSQTEFPQPHCPRCGSIDIAFQGSSRAAALTALAVLGLPLPLGPKTWRCNTCDAQWEDTEDNS